jgi:hypothetical protein
MSFIKTEDTLKVLENARAAGRWESSYLLLSKVDSLLQTLKLTPLERLSSDDSHNYALLVEAEDKSRLVLKMISQSTSLETECLREWHLNPQTDSLCPKLENYGELPNGGKWNLQEFLNNNYTLPSISYGFKERGKDFERIGKEKLAESMQLARGLKANNFNKALFPDELDVMLTVIHRELETKNKELSILAAKLMDTREFLSERTYLIHGDYHIGNIAFTDNGNKVIDPFGVRGTDASDAASYIALSCRDEGIKESIRIAQDITDCNRIDLGWLVAANIVKRLNYLHITGQKVNNLKGNIRLAYEALETW